MNLFRQFLERIRDDFGQRRVIPWRAEKIEDLRAHCQRAAEGMDEFAGIATDDLGSENPSPFRLRDDLHVPVIIIERKLDFQGDRVRKDINRVREGFVVKTNFNLGLS